MLNKYGKEVQRNKKGPSFQDYRTTSDGVMVADVGFKKQLWALDPELDVVWDWAAKKWEIWRFPGQARVKKKRLTHDCHHMLTVQTEGRSFRELGADILLKLQAGDPTRYTVDEMCKYFDAIDDNIRRAKEKSFKNLIESITSESLDFIRGAPKARVPVRIKSSDKKYLLKLPTKKFGVQIFKPARSNRVARVVGGENG